MRDPGSDRRRERGRCTAGASARNHPQWCYPGAESDGLLRAAQPRRIRDPRRQVQALARRSQQGDGHPTRAAKQRLRRSREDAGRTTDRALSSPPDHGTAVGRAGGRPRASAGGRENGDAPVTPTQQRRQKARGHLAFQSQGQGCRQADQQQGVRRRSGLLARRQVDCLGAPAKRGLHGADLEDALGWQAQAAAHEVCQPQH